MGVYVVGRLNDHRVPWMMDKLRELDFEVTLDWTRLEVDAGRPFLAHRGRWRPVALDETRAIDEARVVVLLDGPSLKGAMFELGWALRGGKPVLAWMDPERPLTDSLFFTMPGVQVYPEVPDLLAALVDLRARLT